MFGVSFQELLLVGLVALLVLGPERLPSAARTAGLWIGRLKRSFNAIKQEVEREIGADEIRRQLHNEHILGLEEEARKLFNQNAPSAPQPPAEQPADVEPEPAPSVDSAPVEAGPEHSAPRTHLSLEKAPKPSVPAAAAPSVHDSSLPPRAP
jgi:sec-independent protein translocase protein TatB